MKRTLKQLPIFIVLLLLFISCNKNKSAQLPSNKISVIDSTDAKLQQYNEKLIIQEDSILTAFVDKQSTHFKKNDIGIWIYTIKENANGKPLVDAQEAQFDYTIYSLEKDFIERNENIKITFGKKMLPKGLEEGIKLMRTKEKAQFIIPWYLSYGINGKGAIPPYASLIFEVTTKDEL